MQTETKVSIEKYAALTNAFPFDSKLWTLFYHKIQNKTKYNKNQYEYCNCVNISIEEQNSEVSIEKKGA